MEIRNFSELNAEERKKIFDYTVSFGKNRYFATFEEMEKDCSGMTFGFGKNHLSAWEDGTVKGTIAAITREVDTKGEAYVTAVNVKKEDAGTFSSLLDSALLICSEAGSSSVKLGIKPDFGFLKETVLSKGFEEVYRSILMRYGKMREDLRLDENLLLGDLSDENKEIFRRIHNDAFRNSPNGGSLDDTEIEEMILGKSNLAGVSFYCGNPVGIYETTVDDGKGFIDEIGVDPALHGKGYGRMTLGAIMEKLYAMKVSEIRLSVMSSNERAFTLYVKTGFSEEKTLSVWFGKIIER